MAYDYKIFWSDEAIYNLESILDYLQSRWTQREIDKLKTQPHNNLCNLHMIFIPILTLGIQSGFRFISSLS